RPSFSPLSADHRDLHSFPTRRSSDLAAVTRHAGRLSNRRDLSDVPRAGAAGGGHLVGSILRRRLGVAQRGWLAVRARDGALFGRSEEHTSELQSLTNLVCRLLLEQQT